MDYPPNYRIQRFLKNSHLHYDELLFANKRIES